jgi:cell wall-associated NlpC family hydrolase
VLSATRRRVLPASILITGALAVGVLGATVPAQAAPASVVPASIVPASVAATLASTTVATSKVATAKATAAAVTKVRTKAVAIARAQVGDRYVAGHSGPNKFDCSGLALYVVKNATGRTLPHYSKAQYAATKRVAKKDLRPGDLVFFFKGGAHHTGVYIGGGKMVSAKNPRKGVQIDAVFSGWYGKRYSGAGRLV